MRKALGIILAVMMLTAILPVTALQYADAESGQSVSEGQTGTIVNCKTKVNVRAQASSKSKILGTAKKGETFKVLGTSGSWVKIDFNGKDGYVYKTYIRVEGTPSETSVEGKVGTVFNCKTQVNVREKASSKSKLLGTAKKGETFKVLATAGSWVKVAYTSETAGYIFHTYIKIANEGEAQPTPAEGKVAKIVNCKTQVNVREEASSKSKLLGTAKKGTTYKVLGTSGNWVKIEFDSKEGYIYKSYARITEPEASIDGKTGTIVNCKTDVNVREKASSKSKLLGKAKKGEIFTVRGRSGNWIEIEYNGKTGYVYKTYLKIS